MGLKSLRGFATAWTAWFLASSAVAQPLAESTLRTRLAQVPASYTSNYGFMGAALIAEGDHVLLIHGYGQADIEWDIANSPVVKFRIGSLTKQFTSALILMLQQDGKLDIADAVTKYLPSAPSSWSRISLSQLLGHVSGIANFTDDPAFSTWSASPRTTAEKLSFIEAMPLQFKPGGKFSYSNSNYEVLGAIIEKVTGQSYSDVLRQRIIDPLALHDTGPDTDDLILPKRAQGYQLQEGGELRLAKHESISVVRASASLYSTTGDLLKWERGLFGGKLLTPASLKLMTTPGKGHYGLGLNIQNINGIRTISHNGGVEGFTSHLTYIPARNLTAIAISNVGGPAPDLICSQMLDVAMGKKVLLPSERKAVPILLDKLNAYTGPYASAEMPDLNIYRSGNQLFIGRKGDAGRSMFYEGMKGGHALFYVPSRFYEVEFTPNQSSPAVSITFHFADRDVMAEHRGSQTK